VRVSVPIMFSTLISTLSEWYFFVHIAAPLFVHSLKYFFIMTPLAFHTFYAKWLSSSVKHNKVNSNR
jgi:hypothetical protein